MRAVACLLVAGLTLLSAVALVSGDQFNHTCTDGHCCTVATDWNVKSEAAAFAAGDFGHNFGGCLQDLNPADSDQHSWQRGMDKLYVAINTTNCWNKHIFPSTGIPAGDIPSKAVFIQKLVAWRCAIDFDIDGAFSDWSTWSPCDSDRQFSYRQCNNPPQFNGGANCTGDFIRMQSCTNDASSIAPWTIGVIAGLAALALVLLILLVVMIIVRRSHTQKTVVVSCVPLSHLPTTNEGQVHLAV